MAAIVNLLFVAIVVATTVVESARLRNHHETNFLSKSMNAVRELEIRVSYNGIRAIEAMIPDVQENGLFYREVTDGRRLITAVFTDRVHLVDCDMETDEKDLAKFWERFLVGSTESSVIASDYPTTYGNQTFTTIEGEIDPLYEPLVNFEQLKESCKELHRALKAQLRGKKHHERVAEIESAESDESTEAIDEASRSRVKRAMLIYPGTNWCGSGNEATGYNDLGENVATDKCCREHDHCPYTIEGLTTNFNLFNYRFHTISHCNCDEAFRSCLKSAGNSVANMVGDLFFNVVSTKCFTLKPMSTCVKRNWWLKCTEYKREYEAVMHQPTDY